MQQQNPPRHNELVKASRQAGNKQCKQEGQAQNGRARREEGEKSREAQPPPTHATEGRAGGKLLQHAHEAKTENTPCPGTRADQSGQTGRQNGNRKGKHGGKRGKLTGGKRSSEGRGCGSGKQGAGPKGPPMQALTD